MSNDKLWNKGYQIDSQVEQFTVGNDRQLDLRLVGYDIQGSQAHARMLAAAGLITPEECDRLTEALDQILKTVVAGEFRIEEGVEDVHSQVELLLTARLGTLGKKIHAARSRNDQVAVDVKLFLRDQLSRIAGSVQALFEVLQGQSERYSELIMPGYTHMQVAMPSSFGLWLGAYAETLTDDMELLIAARKIVNRNPLGSAAGYGASFPIDRQITTERLGFESMNWNSMASQMSRVKAERAVAVALAALAATMGRLAMDVCLYAGQNFGFIRFPDTFTTGSSIMPHKKNPDVMELVRGHCNRLQALPSELTLLTTNLPSGYHREMQLSKDILFPALDECVEAFEMCRMMIEQMEVNDHLVEDSRYDLMFTVERVNALVGEGMAFRDAYRSVADQVAQGTFRPDHTLRHTHQGSIGNLCTDQIRQRMQRLMSSFE